MDPRIRDIAVKTFWTAVSAVLGVVLVTVTDMENKVWWAPLAIAGINALTVLVRQAVNDDVPPPAEERASATVS